MTGRPNPVSVIRSTDPAAIPRAADVLRSGGLVVIPTDTVYGVAASVDRPDAVARLYTAKGRPLDKPIPVLVSSIEQVPRLTQGLSEGARRLLTQFWPGALTVALPAAAWLPSEIVRDTGRVGLRMPDYSLTLAMIEASGGALATTSANRSGESEAKTAEEAVAALGDRVDLIVDGGPVPGGVPSTVVVVTDDQLEIARLGAVPAEVLPAYLSELLDKS